MSELVNSQGNVASMHKITELIRKQYEFAHSLDFKVPEALPPYVLIGPPGIGKTQILILRSAMQEMASKLGYEFIEYETIMRNPKLIDELLAEQNRDKYFVFVYLNLSTLQPTDFSIPNMLNTKERDGISTYSSSIPEIFHILQKQPGLLFLDEFTNVQDNSMAAAIYKLLSESEVGPFPLHPGVLVIAAGNDVSNSEVVNSRITSVSLLDRVIVFRVLPPKEEKENG